MLGLLLWSLGAAWAAQGTLIAAVDCGPDSAATVLPHLRPGFYEVIVQRCDADLHGILDGRTSPVLEAIDTYSTGLGTWFIRVKLPDEQHHLEAVVRDGRLGLASVQGQRALVHATLPAPTLAELVEGLPPQARSSDPVFALKTLGGDALSLPLEPWQYDAILAQPPDWLPTSSWDAIDQERAVFLAEPNPRLAVQARYRLALHYLAMGFGQEAAYYLHGISAEPGPVPQRDISLARGRAALVSRRWDVAREAFVQAWKMGAADDGVVEGLAVVSLATGDPARAPTARLLVKTTARPAALRLAVELLQRDGFVGESRPLLLVLDDLESAPLDRQLALRLGDASLVTGETGDAERAWDVTSPELRDVRGLYMRLLEGDPADWSEATPELVRMAEARTDGGAEALYMLAQIDAAVGTPSDTLSELSAFMRRFPVKSENSDVPERFWSVYRLYIKALADEGAWMRIAAVHESSWNALALRAVDDPDVLLNVAHAYEEVGLPEQATLVLRSCFAVALASGEQAPELLYHLAELYAETGNWVDGLDTMDYMARRGLHARSMAETEMLRARLYIAGDQPEAAARALRKAAMDRQYRDEATVRLAVMDADEGRCARAVPTLRRLLFSTRGLERYRSSAPWLSLARCLAAAGDGEGAARAAREAAGRSDSEVESRYAMWLAAVGSGWQDKETMAALVAGDDVWAAMAREQQDARLFDEELASRRAP